jgi:catechol 2,3-dioxygenase-like lactoylglutathione lyase family enzyme
MDTPPIGRFLELSVYAPDVRESLAFYEALGFEQASAGEALPYPYAVVTDGRIAIGLHGERIRAPALSFVLPNLRLALERLARHGIDFEEQQLGDDVFNQAAFTDPTGHCVRLLEARTFSPPQLAVPESTTCGYFVEYGLPTRDVAAAQAFWEPLGFVGLEERPDPFVRTELTSALLNLGLYRSRAFRHPVLTFEADDMRERLARLRERGMTLSDEMPDTLDETRNAVLIAPEGTRLLLLQSPT